MLKNVCGYQSEVTECLTFGDSDGPRDRDWAQVNNGRDGECWETTASRVSCAQTVIALSSGDAECYALRQRVPWRHSTFRHTGDDLCKRWCGVTALHRLGLCHDRAQGNCGISEGESCGLGGLRLKRASELAALTVATVGKDVRASCLWEGEQ